CKCRNNTSFTMTFDHACTTSLLLTSIGAGATSVRDGRSESLWPHETPSLPRESELLRGTRAGDRAGAERSPYAGRARQEGRAYAYIDHQHREGPPAGAGPHACGYRTCAGGFCCRFAFGHQRPGGFTARQIEKGARLDQKIY